jgi:hypothetical protein
MRELVLAIAVVFMALLAALTISDFANNGVTAIGILAIAILVLFGIGIVGALRHPPEE